METKIKCPNCGQEYVIDNSFIGQAVNCEKCGTKFTARKLAAVSPAPNALPDSILFNPDLTNRTTPSSQCPPKQPTSFSPSFPLELSVSDHEESKETWNWVKAFFDFKIMVTPSLIRMSFLFVLILGAIAILIIPFRLPSWGFQHIYLEDTKEIFIFAIKYMAVIILGIPLYALILHIVYELTMIPFSILDVLKEIRNKQDKDTKN